jgi:hypothetical protein
VRARLRLTGHLFQIEDPFDTEHDLGRVVTAAMAPVMREELRRAVALLSGGNLKECTALKPPMPPPPKPPKKRKPKAKKHEVQPAQGQATGSQGKSSRQRLICAECSKRAEGEVDETDGLFYCDGCWETWEAEQGDEPSPPPPPPNLKPHPKPPTAVGDTEASRTEILDTDPFGCPCGLTFAKWTACRQHLLATRHHAIGHDEKLGPPPPPTVAAYRGMFRRQRALLGAASQAAAVAAAGAPPAATARAAANAAAAPPTTATTTALAPPTPTPPAQAEDAAPEPLEAGRVFCSLVSVSADPGVELHLNFGALEIACRAREPERW